MLTSKFMNLEGGEMKVKFWTRRRVWTMWLAMGVSLVVVGAAQAMAVDPGSGKSYAPASSSRADTFTPGYTDFPNALRLANVSSSTANTAVRPDDRAVRVTPTSDVPAVGIRPDDRAIRVGPPADSTPVLVATDSKGGLDWSDATYGLLVGFMLALLAAGIAVAMRSRGRLAHS
jgi:hypothetical protein